MIFSKLKTRLIIYKRQQVLKIIGYFRNIEGWLSDKEAIGLYLIARKLSKNSIIVEIGSWKGKSTFCIDKGLKKGTIYAIDPFNAEGESGSKEIYEANKGTQPLINQFQDNIKLANSNNKIEILKGYSNQFADYFKEIDFLFIDGDHSIEGCKYDYETFSGFVKVGGFLAFHDYDPERFDLGPTWVINNRLKNNHDFAFYKSYDSLWIAKRIS